MKPIKKEKEITYGVNGMEIKTIYGELVEKIPPVIIRGRVKTPEQEVQNSFEKDI